jgi:hypothetical protein
MLLSCSQISANFCKLLQTSANFCKLLQTFENFHKRSQTFGPMLKWVGGSQQGDQIGLSFSLGAIDHSLHCFENY